MFTLRAYQEDAIERVREAMRAGKRRIILQLPTGAGKTVIASHIIAESLGRHKKIMFLAHRRELVDQCSSKLHENGVRHGVFMAGRKPQRDRDVIVASIQTIHRRCIVGKKEPWELNGQVYEERTVLEDRPEASLIVIDECHHATARTWKEVVDAYPTAWVLGLSATPSRKDGKPLRHLFDELVNGATYAKLIDEGSLVETVVYAPKVPDLSNVKVSAGDYNAKQLGEAMNKARLVGDIVEHWKELGERRKTVCFSSSVAHSEAICERFNTDAELREEYRHLPLVNERLPAGLAIHVDGKMGVEERMARLGAFAAGQYQILCNCMLLTEGWDCPQASCAILARPTKSLVLYRQMAGRIQRPWPPPGVPFGDEQPCPACGGGTRMPDLICGMCGNRRVVKIEPKANALILDHAAACHEHGLPTADIPWTLFDRNRAEQEKAVEKEKRKTRRCRACGLIYAVKLDACPKCGAKPAKRQIQKEAQGRLERYERGGKATAPPQMTDGAYVRIWLSCVKKAAGYGHTLGRAVHTFKSITGRLPWKVEALKGRLPRDGNGWQQPASRWISAVGERVETEHAAPSGIRLDW